MAKLHSRNQKNYEFPFVSPETQSYILSLTASELSQVISQGKISSVQVVSTYCQRAHNIGRSYNLTAEENFDQALELAKICDEDLSKGCLRGSLHGVPFSVKDHITMKGCISSAGMIWLLDHPDEETAITVKILIEEGGIPFVRSNVPQAISWIETENAIYGRADNPWDRFRTPGGSTGGEGGLICSRSSPLGIGTDIGGSIRSPCNNCGVYGFRPTPQRISLDGVRTASDYDDLTNYDIIAGGQGPMGRSVDDLVMIIRAWMKEKMFRFDPVIVPLPFDEKMFGDKKRLKIGYFYDLPCFMSTGYVKEAILRCGRELSKNHEVVSFEFKNAHEIVQIFIKLISVDGNTHLKRALHNEPPMDFYKLQFFTSDHPWVTNSIKTILKALGHKRLHSLMDSQSYISPSEYISLYRQAEKICQEAIDQWANEGLDIIICPTLGVAAPYHGGAAQTIPGLAFSYIWNLLKFPSGIVPVGLVKNNEVGYKDEFNDPITQGCCDQMQNTEGMPYGIQIVAQPYKDEIALRVMKEVEGIFDFHKYAL
ncbi:hypothetical protein SteCoe_3695 [Stentor coeruleus]|uniref:Amidase domain-containing protein n=1 Tax=Stentor coeruleus TaxID=5963 RepID=A0A1R2CWG5_9CILI|nr:hypothetical protein SteCoe_3695 [Stentor coeruleus]